MSCLHVSCLQTNPRTKRQSTTNSTKDLRCEERFVAAAGLNQFILVSACPADAPDPTLDRFRQLCQLLMRTINVLECKYPDGTTESAPTPMLLPPARYVCTLILHTYL